MLHKIKYLSLFSFLLLVITFVYCSKDPASPGEQRDELKARGSISGYVTDMSKNPLANVYVCIDSGKGTPCLTDNNGAFTIEEVLEGTYTLVFRNNDYEDIGLGYKVTVGMGEKAILPDTVKLSYKWYRFAGKIIYNDSAVSGAGVSVAKRNISTLTDENGSFTLDKIPMSETPKLICAKSGVGFTTITGIAGKRDETVTLDDITFDKEGVTVSGTVYDSNGKVASGIVVASVGGGITDTTDVNGMYSLKNVPSNETSVRIYAVVSDSLIGSMSGLNLENNTFLQGNDIYLHKKSVLTNGVHLDGNNIVVKASAKNITLSVFPTTDSITFIEKYEWFFADSISADTITDKPVVTVAKSALTSISGLTSINVAIWVQAINLDGKVSSKLKFTVMIRDDSPTAKASVGVGKDSTFADTVTISIGSAAALKGVAYDPFGGIDTVVWRFGDGTNNWMNAGSMTATVQHIYDSVGTFTAILEAVDTDGNTAYDSVIVIVKPSEVPTTSLKSPADSAVLTNVDSVALVWYNVGESGILFNVYMDKQNNPPAIKIGSLLSDTTLIAAVETGNTYWWQIEVVQGKNSRRMPVNKFFVRDTVPTPIKPQGTVKIKKSIAHTYLTQNPDTTYKKALEYRFDWGDGDTSAWTTAASAAHGFDTLGNYSIRAQVKRVDNGALSLWSEELDIVVEEDPHEVPTTSLKSPADSAVLTNVDSVALVWYNVGESGILFNVYMDKQNNPPAIKIGSLLSDTTLIAAVETGNTYWWQIEVVQGKNSRRMPVNKFFVRDTVPTPIKPQGTVKIKKSIAHTYLTQNPDTTYKKALEYRFDWGDGDTSAWTTAASAAHGFDTLGNYSIRAQVKRVDNGALSLWSEELDIVVEEDPHVVTVPLTPASSDTLGDFGITYSYTTGGSVDSKGYYVEYRFSWGDGTFSNWSLDKTHTHQWSTDGIYEIRAQARSKTVTTVVSGFSSVLSITIDSKNHKVPTPPTPVVNKTPVWTDTVYTFTIHGADTLKDNRGYGLEFCFLWDDGDTSEWKTDGYASHSWDSAKTYLVKVKARSKHNSTIMSEWSKGFLVTIHAVTPPGIPQSRQDVVGKDIEETFFVTWAKCNREHMVEYQFNWGDGDSSAWSIDSFAVHKWSEFGTFNVQVRARCIVDKNVISKWGPTKVVYVTEIITDIDGNNYCIVTIGTQTWTAENLRTTKYNDGTDIPHVTDGSVWSNLSTPGYCFYNNTTNADSKAKFGALYNWYTVNTGKLAPAGWHVPTDAEWDTLTTYLIANGYNWDGTTTGNKVGKSLASKTDWISSGTKGCVGNDLQSNNSTGFSALPGGCRYSFDAFGDQSDYGYWWSSTEYDASYAYNRYLGYNYEYPHRDFSGKQYGFSVRLVRDN